MAGFHGNGISGWVEFVAIGITLPLSTIDRGWNHGGKT